MSEVIKNMTGATLRIYELFELNQDKWISAPTICQLAEVSSNAYRNRLSELRVDHGCVIQSERINTGMWKYKYTGRMTKKEYIAYQMELQIKKAHPAGDKELFEKVMRALHNYAKDGAPQSKSKAGAAMNDWAMDYVEKLKREMK